MTLGGHAMKGWLALLLSLVPAASLLAHHSLASFDTTTPVRVKGIIVQFNRLNPHSFIYLDETRADGAGRRWAVEGPSGFQLTRSGFATDALKVGDAVEVCGYLPKEPVMWQIASADPTAASLAGRLINAELLVMPNGHERSWGDYGVHKCFAPGHRDQHSK
jgi:hypothetical protein